jgi:hypothetical protein
MNDKHKCEAQVWTGWTYTRCYNPVKLFLTIDGQKHGLCGLHHSHYRRGNRISLLGRTDFYYDKEAHLLRQQKEKEKYQEKVDAQYERSFHYWLDEIAKKYGITVEEAKRRLEGKPKKG